MFTFQPDIPVVVMVLFGIAAAMVLVFIFTFVRPAWRVAKAVKQEKENESTAEGICPVSVIVFANDEADSLRRLLPSILGQRYSGPFEVIVVNEGESDATSEVVDRLKHIHDNLYLTYTPDGARQLSRKKLALMIGIKAARYPVVVHTTASAVIESDEWLSRITAPFSNPDIEVVIGYAGFDPRKDSGFGRRSRTFNAAADAVCWLDAALRGKPYRGIEQNLAYTRDAFFNNRGFSRSLNLKSGDDDIFINEIANPENTAVVLHPDAMVRCNVWNVSRGYREMRSRYNFTGKYIPRGSRRLMAFGTWMFWGCIILSVVGAFLSWPNLFGLSIGVFLVLTSVVLGTLFWRKVVNALTAKKMLFTLPLLILGRPFANIVSAVKALRHKRHNYTWTN